MSSLHSDASARQTQALYLLGFSKNEDLTTALDRGSKAMLEHLGIESFQAGTVIAWFKRIEREDFEGPQGEKNLADIQWLTPRVIAHERVVSCLSQQMAFYPARFGTLFSSSKSLLAFTLQTASTLSTYFDLVGTSLEWGLKFYGDTMRASEILAQRDGLLQDGKPVGGANYLKLRQMQRERNNTTPKVLDEAYAQALASLQAIFSRTTSRPIIAAPNDAKREELVGNLALLLDPSESKQLGQWTDTWNEDQASKTGLRVELSGPWPAYSFCPSLSPDRTEVAA